MSIYLVHLSSVLLHCLLHSGCGEKQAPGVVKSSTGNSSYFIFQKYVLSKFMLQHNNGLVKSYIYCLHQWLQNLLMLCGWIFQMFATTGPEEKCYSELK